MAGDVTVRARRETDIPASAAALVAVHASDGYPVEGVADPRAWLMPPGLLESWVAELDGEVVGHVSVSAANHEDAVMMWTDVSGEPRERIAVLARLFVLPGARRRAVGERLTLAATDFARRSGHRLVLDVMAKDQAAIRLYERLGWRHIGTTTHVFDGSAGIPAYCYASP